MNKGKLIVAAVIFMTWWVVAGAQGWYDWAKGAKASQEADTIGNLPEEIEGTSSLFLWNGRFWSCNDHGMLTLYAIDTLTGGVERTLGAGVEINDMEEVAQDAEYLYFGDMGDNNGVREDLRVLRASKARVAEGIFEFDTIWFWYPERVDSNATDFDCEAFVAADTVLLFFTKQWDSQGSDCYAVPKRPGRWEAQRLFSLATEGMVTGACYQPGRRMLVMCGYNMLCLPFIYVVNDFDGLAIDEGEQLRVALTLGMGCQTEGIATSDGQKYYLTCEKLNYMGVEHPAQLFSVDLSGYLGTGDTVADGEGVFEGWDGADGLTVYPNPTDARIHMPREDVLKAEVVDMQGRVMTEWKGEEWLDLSSLEAGQYMLRLTLQTGVRKTVGVVKR